MSAEALFAALLDGYSLAAVSSAATQLGAVLSAPQQGLN